MSEVVVPLGVGNIRSLTKQLKALSRQLRDDIKVDIERETCAEAATYVVENVAGIPDVDGNYDSTSVTVEVSMTGHEVIWRGKQITFLEFGTGAAGARGGYPGAAMAMAGYRPDPTKEVWVYGANDKVGGARISHGLTPQAPMLNAAVRLEVNKPYRVIVTRILNKAVRDAVTL